MIEIISLKDGRINTLISRNISIFCSTAVQLLPHIRLSMEVYYQLICISAGTITMVGSIEYMVYTPPEYEKKAVSFKSMLRATHINTLGNVRDSHLRLGKMVNGEFKEFGAAKSLESITYQLAEDGETIIDPIVVQFEASPGKAKHGAMLLCYNMDGRHRTSAAKRRSKQCIYEVSLNSISSSLMQNLVLCFPCHMMVTSCLLVTSFE